MAFFNSAITILQTLVVALGAGLGAWGVINLLEGYGNDNPGAKSQGIKQLMAAARQLCYSKVVRAIGADVARQIKDLACHTCCALIGTQLIPLLSGLFG